MHPTRFRIADISKTHTDPIAKVIRTKLRKEGIKRCKVVFSDENPIVIREEVRKEIVPDENAKFVKRNYRLHQMHSYHLWQA